MPIAEGYPLGNHQAYPDSKWGEAALDHDHIKGLVADLIPSEEVRKGRNFGVHIVDGQDEASAIGRYVEHAVFDEFFNNDRQKMEEEYGPYDDSSTFLLVLDYEKSEPTGAVRLIRPSETGLKSMNDLISPASPWYQEGDTLAGRFEEIGNDPEHTIDIGTMAVMPEYRSSHSAEGVSAALYSTCVQWSLSNGYNHWVTVVDKKIYDMMQSWGEPFQAFNGTDWASYIDSPASLPVHTELYSGLERIQKFDREMSEKHGQNFNVHGLYTRGEGLEEQFVLPALESAVQ